MCDSFFHWTISNKNWNVWMRQKLNISFHRYIWEKKIISIGFSTFILSSLQNRYKQIKARYLFSKSKPQNTHFVFLPENIFLSLDFYFSFRKPLKVWIFFSFLHSCVFQRSKKKTTKQSKTDLIFLIIDI